MLNEEVEDEITALSSIYEDTFSRTDEDKIRVIITPADEDVSSEGDTSVLDFVSDIRLNYRFQFRSNESELLRALACELCCRFARVVSGGHHTSGIPSRSHPRLLFKQPQQLPLQYNPQAGHPCEPTATGLTVQIQLMHHAKSRSCLTVSRIFLTSFFAVLRIKPCHVR